MVYAPSVKKIVGGEFSDGFKGYRARPAYRNIGDSWILEKWVSALEFTNQTEAMYNETERLHSGLFPTGPYPHRGVYCHCETLACAPEDANFDKLIALIMKGKYNRPQDNMLALMKSLEDKEKADQQERFDRCKEMLPAFGVRAASYRSHVKPTKSAPMMKSANELGLPVRGPAVTRVKHAI